MARPPVRLLLISRVFETIQLSPPQPPPLLFSRLPSGWWILVVTNFVVLEHLKSSFFLADGVERGVDKTAYNNGNCPTDHGLTSCIVNKNSASQNKGT